MIRIQDIANRVKGSEKMGPSELFIRYAQLNHTGIKVEKMAADKVNIVSEDHPRCETCMHYTSGEMNKGSCKEISRVGEKTEANKYGAASNDGFWVAPWFYCALHTPESIKP